MSKSKIYLTRSRNVDAGGPHVLLGTLGAVLKPGNVLLPTDEAALGSRFFPLRNEQNEASLEIEERDPDG